MTEIDVSSLRTQKDIKVYTRKILEKIGICTNIKNSFPTYYIFFTKFLFPRHPEYPHKFHKMLNLGIRYNKVFKKQKEVYIINKDNTTDSVSVMKKCISGKKSDNLTIAMRNSITPQIIVYKNQFEKLQCTLCENSDNIQVDHHKPQFIELKNTFLDQYCGEIPTSFDDNNFNSKIFSQSENDDNFKNSWINFHKNNAILRLLCRTCNLTRKKAKI